MSVIERSLIEEVARGLYGGDDWGQRHDTWDPGMVEDWMKRAETAIRVVRAVDTQGAVKAERERLTERFHEYVRRHGRHGYDGPHLDRFLAADDGGQ